MSSNVRKLRVLGISGSLRQGSFNTAALRAAAELAPDYMTIEIADISALPLYNDDVRQAGYPAPVEAFRRQIAEVDAVLFATPEYNYSISGVLKNAIDWASRPPRGSALQGKPAAIMGATPGMGGTGRAQMALRQSFVFTQTYALLSPEVLVARAADKFDAAGKLTDEPTRKFVSQLLAALMQWAPRFKPAAG